MAELLRHKVRFGELSFGPYVHNATFFDLLIQATEELSYDLDYAVEDIVEAGGVPYAPVAMESEMQRYPEYDDTIVVEADPVAVGETNVQLAYTLRRESDGREFGTVTMVQITITPDGVAEQITPELREKLQSYGSTDLPPVDVSPRTPNGNGPRFTHDVTFRTPHIEAAGLGYFEDYAREFSVALEQFLASSGNSLRALSGDRYPFVPVEWNCTLEDSIRFEDDITVVGQVLDVADDEVSVAYEMRRGATSDVCIAADFTYGCFDDDGQRVDFQPAALAPMRE